MTELGFFGSSWGASRSSCGPSWSLLRPSKGNLGLSWSRRVRLGGDLYRLRVLGGYLGPCKAVSGCGT
eukprot:6946020-Pyramimonas_sp.AAC.1